MADSTGRRLEVLALLQSHPGITAMGLADRLDVTERTARRDVARLREIGYRIDATSGRHGGYTLAGSVTMPPLVLDTEEALAVALGLRAASGVGGLAPAAITALTKLTSTAPPRMRAQFEAVAATESSGHPDPRAADPKVLLALAFACRAHGGVRFRHRRDGAGRGRLLDAQPHRLVTLRGRWYLVAHERGRHRWRTYAVDRVSEVRPLGTRVDAPHPPADAIAFVTAALSGGERRYQVRVRLHTSADLARELFDPAVGHIDDDGDDSVLSLTTDDLDWVARWLVYRNVDLDVIEPPELVLALHTLGRWLAGRHTPA